MMRWVPSVLVLMFAAGSVRADGIWFGIRNDTTAPVVVQTGVVVNGSVVPGRPVVLLPGEIAWDHSVKPCVKAVALASPKNPKAILFRTSVSCGPKDVFLSIRYLPPNQYRVLPATPPAKRPDN